MESGLQFDFSYADNTSPEQILAFETAGMMWSDYIKDDMTVQIHVEMTDTLPDNVIGGALPGMVADVNYSDFLDAYEQDKSTWRDDKYFDSLSVVQEGSGGKGPGGTWEKFEARIDFGGDHYVEDSANLNMTRANYEALGLPEYYDALREEHKKLAEDYEKSGEYQKALEEYQKASELPQYDHSGLDGYIMMNKLSKPNFSLEWDYNPGWSGSESLDFLSTAVHEIGHVLGFVSGVDKYEGLKFDDVNSFWNHFGTYDAFKDYTNNVLDYANPLDLFRYSQESLDINSGRNTIDLSVGAKAYFGPAKLWDAYATGKEVSLDGDGFQASHWKHSENNNKIIGIMDPLMTPGVIRRISNRDVRAMDAIGYDVTSRGERLLNLDAITQIWRPMTGEGTDIGTLQSRAKDRIDKKMYSDRSWEIDSMIGQSEVYEGRRSRYSSGRTRRYAQEIFWQEAYFSSISSEYSNAPSSPSFDSAFALTSIVQIEQNTFETNIINETKDMATLQDDDREAIEITSVSVNLLSIEAGSESVNTVSTEIKTELVSQSDLYGEQLEETDLYLFSI